MQIPGLQRVPWGRLGSCVRDAWLMIGGVLVLLLLIECAATLIVWARTPSDKPFDTRRNADDLRDAPWADAYLRELRESQGLRWEPFVYWSRKPYAGRYVNVGEDGLRITAATTASAPNARQLRIFFFGGSTMWATGARDEHTIPSLVVGELARRGIAAEAVNYGEGGFVMTQGVFKLLLELRKGKRPDLVVFYDGINDVYSAMQSGVAGIPQNESNRAREFNLTNPARAADLLAEAAAQSSRQLNSLRLLGSLARKLAPAQGAHSAPAVAGDQRALAAEVVRVYRENLHLVDLVGKAYGFQAFFYWQPAIYDKPVLSAYEAGMSKRLTEFEAGLRGSAQPIDMEPFFREVYRMIAAVEGELAGSGRFRDLAGVFSKVSEPVFIDWFHLSERGNAHVAARMAEDIAALEGSTARGRPVPGRHTPEER
jgi:lysophospholipase L1-like esterase